MFLRSVGILFLIQLGFLYGFLDAQQSKSKEDPFFREDYTYIPETRGFYKIHTVHQPWSAARRICAMEGASLFYAEDEAEADEVIAFWNNTQPFHWVYVGISDLLDNNAFETIDGRSIDVVYDFWGKHEPNNAGGKEHCVTMRRDGTLNDDECKYNYPYICKKALDTLEWNEDCDLPDTDYLYNEAFGRCYKFHMIRKDWKDADVICSAELSYLAVVNSPAEADYIANLTANNVKENHLKDIVHLGFRNKNGAGWKTIKGTSLEDSGYAIWAKQPHGGENKLCGSMVYGGKLNDIDCRTKAFFVCEHDIPNKLD